MTVNGSLNSAFLLLEKQIQQLHHLHFTKRKQLVKLSKHQQTLCQLHTDCEQEIETLIALSPIDQVGTYDAVDYTKQNDKGDVHMFKTLLQRSWKYRQAKTQLATTMNRLKQRIKRLEKRIEASKILKANVAAAIKAGRRSDYLEATIELMLVKNQLLLRS